MARARPDPISVTLSRGPKLSDPAADILTYDRPRIVIITAKATRIGGAVVIRFTSRQKDWIGALNSQMAGELARGAFIAWRTKAKPIAKGST